MSHDKTCLLLNHEEVGGNAAQKYACLIAAENLVSRERLLLYFKNRIFWSA